MTTLTKLWLITILFFLPCFLRDVVGVQILSKSKLEKCEKTSDSGDLNCTKKIVLNIAVPSGASGGEASIVAEIVEVEENSSKKMQTFRIPPVVTVNKSAAYALLRDENGHIIEHTEEVLAGPENRTAISNDNFLRANLIGDFVGYTSIPSFEDFYLVIPRQADRNSVQRKQVPLFGVEGRFERINQHPNAGTHSFSIGVTEVINTNLLIELSADDVEYVYQRSPGKILSINIPTFEALTQFGTATITAKNTGEVEASYCLTVAY
ncbi:hypothetical protein ACLB2K_047256 [Fragaria x ananassa]